MTNPPRTTLSINGIKTAVATAGDGKGLPLVMLHGWGAHIGLLWPLAEKLTAAGHTVHTLDLPGFGETPPPSKTWRVADYAAFVRAYMAEAGIERAHLFGHSFGGRISIVLGANHPKQFEKIILCDAAGVKPPTPWYRQLPATLYGAVEGIVGDFGPVQALRDRYRQRVGSEDYLNAGPLKETFLAVIAEDLLPLAPKITGQTLLLWGADDTDTPLWQARALESAIPDAGLVVFKGAGHYSYLDALPDAARVIDYFLTHDE